MILSQKDVVIAANRFIDYFAQFNSITEYQMKVKADRVGEDKEVSGILPFCTPYDDFFQSWDMSPNDMNFSFLVSGQEGYTDKMFIEKLDVVSSHGNMTNIPGRRFRIIVKETNTNTIIGFIHLSSPVISIKPRHDWLGGIPRLTDVNQHSMMGSVIVPTQPFGFNYLGGKLLALICTSHWVREELNKKYPGSEMCLFETTSLYGTTKGMSMYDGLKPFLRHGGDTVSDFPPPVHDHVFTEWDHWFKERNGGEYLVPMITPTANNPKSPTTSRKHRTENKIKSIVKNSLKHYNMLSELQQFNDAITKAKSLTEKKRYYYSTYGYKNVADVLLRQATPEIDPVNWDKHHLENIISWWKNKAQKRWETLKKEDQLRTELEIHGTGMDIDVIR
jgi:hypothetical protein